MDVDDPIWDLFKAPGGHGPGERNVRAPSQGVGLCGCPYCGPKQALNLQEGNYVCAACNSIVSRFLDLGAEWRCFAAEDSRGPDPTRCCPPSNDLLPTLGCVVGRRAGGAPGGGGMSMVHKYQAWSALTYRQRTLCGVFDVLTQNAAQNGIPSCILEEAKSMYKRTSDAQVVRGASRGALVATCLYMACKANNVPRSIREVASMFDVPLGAMTKGYRMFQKVLGSMQVCSSAPEDFVARFCSRLELPAPTVQLVRDIVARAQELGIASNTTPPTLVAGSIMMVSDGKLTRGDVAEASLLAPATIAKCYARMSPHRAVLLGSARAGC